MICCTYHETNHGKLSCRIFLHLSRIFQYERVLFDLQEMCALRLILHFSLNHFFILTCSSMTSLRHNYKYPNWTNVESGRFSFLAIATREWMNAYELFSLWEEYFLLRNVNNNFYKFHAAEFDSVIIWSSLFNIYCLILKRLGRKIILWDARHNPKNFQDDLSELET